MQFSAIPGCRGPMVEDGVDLSSVTLDFLDEVSSQ